MAEDGANKTPGQANDADLPELDLESQLDDIAAALNFDLDDDDDDDDARDPKLDDRRAVSTEACAQADDPPPVEPAPPRPASERPANAVELDELDVEEIEEIDVLDDDVLDDDVLDDDVLDDDVLDDDVLDDDVLDDDVRGNGPMYLELDGGVAEVDQARFVIGRVSKMCDLTIVDVNVSRQHCAIERRDDGYYIVDLGSTNGVLVDGAKVSDHRIAEGEHFVLSSHRIRATFVRPQAPEAPAPVVERPSETQPGTPAVTARLAAVEPAHNADSEPQHLAPQVPDPVAPTEPEPPPEHPHAPQAPGPQLPSVVPHGTFEQRVEQRLEHLTRQVDYLQQQNQILLTHVQQLQSVATLAQMIQQRLAARAAKR